MEFLNSQWSFDSLRIGIFSVGMTNQIRYTSESERIEKKEYIYVVSLLMFITWITWYSLWTCIENEGSEQQNKKLHETQIEFMLTDWFGVSIGFLFHS